MTNDGVIVSDLSSLFLDIFKFFVQKSFTDRLSTQINHKIKNNSVNIGVMLLKLGNRNVPRVRHKKKPTVLLPW